MTSERAKTPPLSLVDIHPDASTEPFWVAAAEHRLVCQRCAACGTRRMPPSPVCAVCRSLDSEWDELSGLGTLYTFTIGRHALMPEMAGSLPHVIGVVELDDAPGIRLVANVVDVEVDEVAIGMALEVTWEDVPGTEVSVYRFRPPA